MTDETRYSVEDVRKAVLLDLVENIERRTHNGERPDVFQDPKVRLAKLVVDLDDVKRALEGTVEMTEVYKALIPLLVDTQEWLEAISALYAIGQGLNVSTVSATVEPTEGATDADRAGRD